MNQIIKATVPAMTLVLSWLFEDRHYTTQMVLSTALTVVGAILAVLNNPQIKEDGVYGIVAACLSAVAGAVSTILLGLLLQRAKINAVTISFASSLPSALVLLPAFFAYEWPVLTDASHFAHKYDDTHVWLAVVAVLACFYNLSRLYLIKFTAAHYSVVAGNVKVAVIVLLSMAVFGDHGGFSAQNWAGVVLTIIGFTVYTVLKFNGSTE